MTGRWKSFLEEHARLRSRIEGLANVADTVGEVPPAALRAGLEGVYSFLSHELLPHIAVEERVLYPAFARGDGFAEAAELLQRDHQEVERLTKRLAELRDRLGHAVFTEDDARSLRRVLYGLFELLNVHLRKEEEVCLPTLERTLSAGELRALADGMDLFEAVEQAAE